MLLELIRLGDLVSSRVLQAHALLDGAAELEEALAQLVGGQLVDGAQAAVAQVVDVVDLRRSPPRRLQHVLDGVRRSPRAAGSSRVSGTSWSNLRLMRKRPTRPRR